MKKRGRPFVVVISPEDYERLLKDRGEGLAVFDEIRERNVDVTPEEAEGDAAREVAALRQEKRERAQGRLRHQRHRLWLDGQLGVTP